MSAGHGATATTNGKGHAGLEPSAWVRRWSHLVRSDGTVLDVACGGGRHVRWFAERGCRVTGIDRDAQAALSMRSIADIRIADIESGPWPLADARFDAVICTNYLWRPLLPTLVACTAANGVLIYETFAAGNQSVGKPSNPDFLLRPGELLEAASGLRVIAYEDGFAAAPDRFVQRLVAVRADASGAVPARWSLPAA